ncbi:MAG: DEAD/DEAH box helicase family protein [Rhodospirillaceae bacterium]|nr:DEAD/DEAH box helicase family protein [Rhodospirillaceae bacterium]
MRTITPEFLDELIDFAPSGEDRGKAFAGQQSEGAVAAFNMLARNGCAYLADEVGMGKTYVALGVMSLLRYLDPHARIVVIAPRENIQRKWVKELHNFVHNNWRLVGNRVKSVQGGPVWPPVVCGSLVEFAREALVNQDRDFFLRMPSFSLRTSNPEDRERARCALLQAVPWLGRRDIPNYTAHGFRDSFAVALNGALPEADLIVVDEAHNLKHGFSAEGSTRNRVMGLAFGHPDGFSFEQPRYRRTAKRVLLLSATPFEDDYAAIQKQLAVFGFGNAMLKGANGESGVSVSMLADPDTSDEEKRRVARRLLIRRVSGLRIGGELYTKNMYRREWRRGGLERHDDPIEIADPRQRLVVALIQKKVAEVLQTERFNNHFQIGMLSSFESFLESVETVRRRGADEPTFDGEEQHRGLAEQERAGIDTDAIGAVVRSYRERFRSTLPHPKLDATADNLSVAFDTGEKTLVFVRRVATVGELAAKLEDSFDTWIRARMESSLPGLRSEISDVFEDYERDRLRRPEETQMAVEDGSGLSSGQERIDRREDLDDDDDGGVESFFAWFFRGAGPPGVLSGAAFQKNRLSSVSSAYATLFEDDHVASLLGAESPGEVLASLARVTGEPTKRCEERLRKLAFEFFGERSRRREGYARLHVFEGYQAAGLTLIRKCGGSLGDRAAIVLEERFPDFRSTGLGVSPPAGFPPTDAGLGLVSIFTELRRRPSLQKKLWPEEAYEDFGLAFRRREQRRELLSAMARLGGAYIDLYLLAIARVGSFALGERQDAQSASELAIGFVDLLERQEREPGFHAFRELSQASEAFDHIVSVNFPDVPSLPLPRLARLYGDTLQRQVPVGRMAGGVNQRLVRQFRMPGFPLVLVTTDVLQEGEDLHTFCRRIVHYGIAWTPSAMEQRTGRVDRIGGLVQRRLDGVSESPGTEEFIQVYYPHLRDTVEVLQVRRVLGRLNRFLRLIHRNTTAGSADARAIDADRAMLEEVEDIPPLEGQLEPAFPIERGWMEGELNANAVVRPDWDRQYDHLDRLWRGLCERYGIERFPSHQRHERSGGIAACALPGIAAEGLADGSVQHFKIGLRSQVAGEETLIECESAIGVADLQDDTVLDALLDVAADAGAAKLCVDPRTGRHHDRLYVRRDILFDPDATELEDVCAIFEDTLRPAIHIHAALRDAGLLGGSDD